MYTELVEPRREADRCDLKRAADFATTPSSVRSVMERPHPLFAESSLIQPSPVAISTAAIVMPVHIVLRWPDTVV